MKQKENASESNFIPADKPVGLGVPFGFQNEWDEAQANVLPISKYKNTAEFCVCFAFKTDRRKKRVQLASGTNIKLDSLRFLW